MVLGESHRKLTEYSLNLLQKINPSMFYGAKEAIINATPEPDNYKDLEFVDVDSPSWTGGRDDPHIKTAADDDDVPHYESYASSSPPLTTILTFEKVLASSTIMTVIATRMGPRRKANIKTPGMPKMTGAWNS
jgi:hypothetical protein